MSQADVELYRRLIDAFNRRDLDEVLGLAHPDVIGVSRVLAVEGGSYRGHDGVRKWWNTILDVFPDFAIEIVSVRERAGLIVAGMRNRAHGEGSGASFDELVWQVSKWRDGRLLRWEMYDSEREALAAAGLRE